MGFRMVEAADFGNVMEDLSQSALPSGRGDLDEVGSSLDGVIDAALERPLATVSRTLSTMPISQISAVEVRHREQPR